MIARTPEIAVDCPVASCRGRNRFDADEAFGAAACGTCGQDLGLAVTPELVASRGPIERCVRCGGADFWLRKDFPRKLGLGIVAVAAVLAFTTYGASLVVASLVDLGFYYLLPEVAVCYRCRAEYRGFRPNRAHGSFDLKRQDEVDEVAEAERRAAKHASPPSPAGRGSG